MASKKTVFFSKPSKCPIISHLAFAVYMVIFANGFKQSLQHLMEFLALYEKESRQLISKEKSCVVGKSTSLATIRIIEEVTEYQRRKLPIKYLGFTLFHGRKKIKYFNDIQVQ